MSSEFYVIGFDDGGAAVQCRGPAPALAYLRRGGCRIISGDPAAVRLLEAEEHERAGAALGGNPDDWLQKMAIVPPSLALGGNP